MRRLFAAAAVLTLTACINDSIGIVGTQAVGGGDLPSTTGVAGVYSLKTVDGKPLPFTSVQTTSEKREILDDALTLTNANTWSRLLHVRSTINGTASMLTLTDAGTYSKGDLGTYLFVAQNQNPFPGTIVNGVISLSLRNPVGDLVPAIYSK
jgi:hypothetical protein